MELDSGESTSLCDGDDILRVRGGAGRLRRVRMREVERLAQPVDVGPADARDAALAQAHRAAGDDAEPFHAAVLLRLVERELQPEADAEHGPAVVHSVAERVVEPAPAQAVHRRARRSNAGKHREVRSRDVAGQARAEARERDLDRARIPGAVVADRDIHMTPFVDGMPSPSRFTATRSARPTALNAASATWCSSRPLDSTWIAMRAACARLDSTCTARPGSRSSFSSAAGRPPRSTAARASASSIGTTASP